MGRNSLQPLHKLGAENLTHEPVEEAHTQDETQYSKDRTYVGSNGVDVGFTSSKGIRSTNGKIASHVRGVKIVCQVALEITYIINLRYTRDFLHTD